MKSKRSGRDFVQDQREFKKRDRNKGRVSLEGSVTDSSGLRHSARNMFSEKSKPVNLEDLMKKRKVESVKPKSSPASVSKKPEPSKSNAKNACSSSSVAGTDEKNGKKIKKQDGNNLSKRSEGNNKDVEGEASRASHLSKRKVTQIKEEQDTTESKKRVRELQNSKHEVLDNPELKPEVYKKTRHKRLYKRYKTDTTGETSGNSTCKEDQQFYKKGSQSSTSFAEEDGFDLKRIGEERSVKTDHLCVVAQTSDVDALRGSYNDADAQTIASDCTTNLNQSIRSTKSPERYIGVEPVGANDVGEIIAARGEEKINDIENIVDHVVCGEACVAESPQTCGNDQLISPLEGEEKTFVENLETAEPNNNSSSSLHQRQAPIVFLPENLPDSLPHHEMVADSSPHHEMEKMDCQKTCKEASLSVNGSPTNCSTLQDRIGREKNACVVCKLGGSRETILCCSGKDCLQNYHLSCLDPPLGDTPPGIWHCSKRVKKKLESGVHLVSAGVEAIYNAKENDCSNDEGCAGTKREKQYFVKYQGLAHVHNSWVPESQLILVAPKLLKKFNIKYQKNKVPLWKSEWTVPQRLLSTRLLMHEDIAGRHHSSSSNVSTSCIREWFVKWRGLGYDSATWELESSHSLSSPEALILIKEYESRCNEAKRASDPSRNDKRCLEKSKSFVKLQRLPCGSSFGEDKGQLQFVNKLRELWHKNQNAVVIDDQERASKVILFILSLVSIVSRPFLIVANTVALPFWESEFMKIAPLINVVSYCGSKDIRELIRSFEFYEEGGCIMFQVLLATPDVIVEDMDSLECIGWESIIVDECQHSRISRYFEQLKLLNSEFHVGLFTNPIKDSVAEYLNILSFIDLQDSTRCPGAMDDENSETLAYLKERLSNYIAYDCKPISNRLLEYWVPVPFSETQIEQYCSTLISNSSSLRLKNDPCGALHDILVSLRTSCDHPYLVDEPDNKDLPPPVILDLGTKASGKLLMLDKVLQEIRKRGQRALILFQVIGGTKRRSVGDILDDYLQLKFGDDSYERIDSGIIQSQKQNALNRFNTKDKGRFVFLIENRACLPSIKLSCVDIVIMFNSELNPSNDLRALQKIHIDFQAEHLMVIRFYSPYTIEEKALIFSTQDVSLESDVNSLTAKHALLTWGACHLFEKFDEIQRLKASGAPVVISGEEKLLNEIVMEVSDLFQYLMHGGSEPDFRIISKATSSGCGYSKSTQMLGELQKQMTKELEPHRYWMNLLDGRVDLRSTAELEQRPKRKKSLFPSWKQIGTEGDDGPKKRSKVAADLVNVRQHKKVNVQKHATEGTREQLGSTDILKHQKTDIAKYGSHSPSICNSGTSECENQALGARQESLHDKLKPELLGLCKVLSLQNDVIDAAQISLEYVMKNYKVPKGPDEILQAFKISLCWIAASILKCKMDRGASLVLAGQHLSFGCKMDQVEAVYYRLHDHRAALKQKILDKSGRNVDSAGSHSSEHASKLNCQGNKCCSNCFECTEGTNISQSDPQQNEVPSVGPPSPEVTSSSRQCEVIRLEECNEIFDNGVCQPGVSIATAKDRCNLAGGDNDALQGNSQPVTSVSQQENQRSLEKLTNSDGFTLDGLPEVLTNLDPVLDVSMLTDKLNITKRQRLKYILQKQKEEFSDFNKFRHEQNSKMMEDYKLGYSNIMKECDNNSLKAEKLKNLRLEFAPRRAEFNKQMESLELTITTKQLGLREKESEMYNSWYKEANAGRSVEPYLSCPLPSINFEKEFKQTITTVLQKEMFELSSKGTSLSGERDNGQADISSAAVSLPSAEAGSSISSSSRGVMLERNPENDPQSSEGIPNVDLSNDFSSTLQNEANVSLRTELQTLPESSACGYGDLKQDSRRPDIVDDMIVEAMDTNEMQVLENLVSADLVEPTCTSPESFQHEVAQTGSLLKAGTSGEQANDRVRDGEMPAQDIVHSPLLPSDDIESPTAPLVNELCQSQNGVQLSSAVIGISQSVEYEVVRSESLTQAGASRQLGPDEMGNEQVHARERACSASLLPDDVVSPAAPVNELLQIQRGLDLSPTMIGISQSARHLPDPLFNEIIRMHKEAEQASSMHDAGLDCEKEIEEIKRKYSALLLNADRRFLQTKKTLESNTNKLVLNRLLAEAFKLMFVMPATGVNGRSLSVA